jgi:membrane protease YdiL (CAAX protease family)
MSLLYRITKHPYGRLLLEGSILLCATYGTWSISQWLLSSTSLGNSLLYTLVISLAQCAIPFAALSLCCWRFEHRSLASIGMKFRNVLRDTSLGILISAGIMSLAVLILWKLGAYQVIHLGPQKDVVALIVGIITAVGAPINEEIFFRGTLFRHLEQLSGSWLALLITGLLFGLIHSWRPYASWHSSFFLAVDVGFLCAGLYMLTRNLWIPMGMHFAWNVCEEFIYGLPNSGTASSVSLLHAIVQGPAWLTGGNFGPEASVLPFGICLILNSLVLVQVIRKQGVVQWTGIAKATPATR